MLNRGKKMVELLKQGQYSPFLVGIASIIDLCRLSWLSYKLEIQRFQNGKKDFMKFAKNDTKGKKNYENCKSEKIEGELEEMIVDLIMNFTTRSGLKMAQGKRI